jgi:hypothetical protein
MQYLANDSEIHISESLGKWIFLCQNKMFAKWEVTQNYTKKLSLPL